MWTLLTTLLLSQATVGSPVQVSRDKIEGIATETLCNQAAVKWKTDHTHVREASDPDTDWEAPEGSNLTVQPVEDRYQMMVPIATCVQVR